MQTRPITTNAYLNFVRPYLSPTNTGGTVTQLEKLHVTTQHEIEWFLIVNPLPKRGATLSLILTNFNVIFGQDIDSLFLYVFTYLKSTQHTTL